MDVAFDQVIRDCGLGEEAEVWRGQWEKSGLTWTAGQKAELICASRIRDACTWLGMPPDIVEALDSFVLKCRGVETVARLAWHCHYELFVANRVSRETVGKWPRPISYRGETIDMFYAFVLVSGIDTVRRIHVEKGIPEDVSRDTLSDLVIWIQDYADNNGCPGLVNIPWMANHFLSNLFKLGRLQFQFNVFRRDFHVFKNMLTGDVLTLAGDGCRLRDDGQFESAQGTLDGASIWESHFRVDNGCLTGCPVTAEGCVVKEEKQLDLSEWEEVLKKDDPVLAIHIPATGRMDHESCGKSMRWASEFFPKHFPEFDFKAFTCESWLLDSQFLNILPESSNIRRFMDEFHLYPIPNADDSQTFERVFGKRYDNIEEAPCKSSLQRAIVDHIRKGGVMRSGGCFALRNDINWNA